jgi:tetratricopeptide (TPR) repeat protein
MSPNHRCAQAIAVLEFAALLIPVFTSPGHAANAPCQQQSTFQALMRRGADPHASRSERASALEQAAKLCPSSAAAYHALAALLIRQQKFQEALAWLQRGLAALPHNPDLTTDLGAALVGTGQPEEALSVLKPLPVTALDSFYLGMAYRALNEHRKAQAALARSFEMGDHDPYLLYALIEQDRELHDTQAGLRDFKTLDEDFPDSAWLHLVLGDAYRSRQDLGSAKREYERAASLDPRMPIVHYHLGRLVFDRGDYSRAIEDFQQEIASDPSFGRAYLYLGTSLRRMGKNQQAVPYLEEAVKRDPGDALGFVALSSSLVEANQLQAALKTLAEGERLFPRDASFPAQMSQLMRRLGKVSGAKKQAATAEALNQKNNQVLSSMPGTQSPLRAALAPKQISRSAVPSASRQDAGGGAIEALSECLQEKNVRCTSDALGQLNVPGIVQNAAYFDLKAQALNLLAHRKEALAAAQQAVRLDPHESLYLITEGHIQQQMGDEVGAIRSFLLAEQLRPGTAEPFYGVGMSFFLIGNANNDDSYYRRAAQQFKTALELAPRDDKAEFMLGTVSALEDRLQDAKREFKQAIQMSPSNPYYRLHYGVLLNRLGDPAGALREMKAAEELDPAYSRAHFRLGALLAQTGKLEQAKTQLEEAARLEPDFASTYFTLGRVYYRLGLREQSKEAMRKFEQLKMKAHSPDIDPVDRAPTSAKPGANKP